MTAADTELPKNPADYRRRNGLGAAGAVALGLLAALAGAGAMLLAPRLLPPPPKAAASLALVAPPPVPPAPIAAYAAAPPAGYDELSRLNARIATLESEGARSSEAAAAALAAAALLDASQGSAPFGRELAALRASAPDLAELTPLERLAETGAPSRAALAATFPDFAARAAAKARKPGESSSLGQRLAYMAARVVTVRRVDQTAGNAPDARLARAEQALQDGDVAAALRSLDGLPPAAQAALAPWRMGAERRAEIDRSVRALRARALRDLAPAPAAGQTPTPAPDPASAGLEQPR